MTPPILSVENLRMEFGGLVAVDGVSFDLYPEQIASLIGPNGAGKPPCLTASVDFTNPPKAM